MVKHADRLPVDPKLLPNGATRRSRGVRGYEFGLFVDCQPTLDVVQLRFGDPLTRTDRVAKHGGRRQFRIVS